MQKEFFGYNSIDKLKDILKEHSSEKIFLVSGKKSYSLSGAKYKINPLLNEKNITFFNDFSPNPEINEVLNGIKKYKQNNPDITIAVGGGSVIDMGKIINLLSNNHDDLLSYIKGMKQPNLEGKPFIAIPTTSGTGSESTHFATVYINKKKYSLADKKLLLPDISIVDPSLTSSMPPYITASTGLDALSQGIESFWSVNSTKLSRSYAKEAVKLAFFNLEKAVNNPDKTSRLNMSKAAHLSGKAINISKTTAAHSISYPITSYFGISHGHAVALTIGQLLEFNANVNDNDCNDNRGADFVKKRLNEIIKLIDCKNPYEAKNSFHSLIKNIGLNLQLHKLNINDEARKLIIDKGFTPERMNNNPRTVRKKDIKKFLDEIK